MKHNHNSETRFRTVCLIILLIFTVLCLAPFVLMFSASITEEDALIKDGYRFFPSQISFATYAFLWAKRETIGRSYLMSIIVTGLGTLTSVIITSMLAYPLARRDFKWRNAFAFIIFFTMMFNGGMTASYIIWTRYFHIKDTFWALLIPNLLMNGMNVLMVRNYYQSSIPDSILEAARVDGASEMMIYRRIILPLSTPVLITISLFTGMAYWNDWTNGLYYITNQKLFTINVYLNNLMKNIQLLASQSSLTEGANLAGLDLPAVGARMAIAMIAVLPVMLIFPFIQGQLIKGVVIGGVKG
ncbi:putative aldouronate transport system permease protein [Lachnospiraceae bacterium NK3A20]|nr:putative aldouronate transport system permease protein [Lachnospiraceae bacterium NK3A20]